MRGKHLISSHPTSLSTASAGRGCPATISEGKGKPHSWLQTPQTQPRVPDEGITLVVLDPSQRGSPNPTVGSVTTDPCAVL